jgi:hypothetical protein
MTGPVWDGVTINPALLVNYGFNDQITYGGFVLPRFLAYLQAGINQAGASITSAATGFVATSSTNTTIATGSKSLTLTADKAFAPGMFILAWDAADPSRFMAGEVTAYDTTSDVLAFTVAAGDTGGSGSVTSWKVSIAGRRGVEGTLWLTGTSAPSDAAGRNGDFYFRSTTGEVFYKVAGTWGAAIADLTGPGWISGSGVPSDGLGRDGDYFFRTDTGDVYQKVAGTWGSPVSNLVGSAWLTGSGVPSDGSGANGDFYFRTANGAVYQKAAGTWGSPIANLTGPQGATGSGSNIHVAEEGTQITASPRPQINFIGDGVTAVDNPAQSRVDVTIGPTTPNFLLMAQGIC